MEENWKEIMGYNGRYSISNLGKVKRNYKDKRFKHKTKILKENKNHKYLNVGLSKNGIVTRFYIHRLVAIHFIPNDKKKIEVNHINGIKTDNRVNNLEWCTRSENMKHAISIGLKTVTEKQKRASRLANSKRVINTENGYIYDSAKLAAKEYGLSFSYLCGMLRGDHINKTKLVYL